jgi:superfamily I DNA/RNA helicase
VVLVGLGDLRDDGENLDNEVLLLYVGMTRAWQ